MYKGVTIPILIPSKSAQNQSRASFLPGLRGLRPVQIVVDDDLQALLKTQSVELAKRLTCVATLLTAFRDNDPVAFRNACNAAADTDAGDLKRVAKGGMTAFKRNAADFLSQEISNVLSAVQLVVWQNGKELVPSLYCRTPESALYLLVLLRASSGNGIGSCPRCTKLFVRKRPDMNYCSTKCSSAHRVARLRAKEKSARSG